MTAKWIRPEAGRRRFFLLGLGLAVASLAHAQPYGRDRDRERERERDSGRERYEISLVNDWDRPIRVSIISERQDERVRENWNIAPRANTWLTHNGGRRLRVRASDRIKLRDDMPSVRIGQVAQWRNGHWVVNARDVVRGQRDKDGR